MNITIGADAGKLFDVVFNWLHVHGLLIYYYGASFYGFLLGLVIGV
jgi:hypothetical protein